MDAETIAAASDALCRVYGDGLSSIEAPEVKSRFTFYDVMGRPIDIVPSGTIVIAHDAEGKVSKIFIK